MTTSTPTAAIALKGGDIIRLGRRSVEVFDTAPAALLGATAVRYVTPTGVKTTVLDDDAVVARLN